MLTALSQDLRYAARTLWRSRGFAVSAILGLAIGIAASTGLFTVVHAVVLHPLPYAGAARLARVGVQPSSGPVRPALINADEFQILQQAATLDGSYIKESFTKTLSGDPFPESVWTEYYTGNALTLLGVQPVAGRVFTEAEAPIGAPPQRVAVLTHRFWQRRFNGRPDAIGQTLRLDGQAFTVIGVIPAAYALDLTDVIVPLPMGEDAGAVWPVHVRLAPGVEIAAAETALQQLLEQFARSRRDAFPPGFRVRLTRLVDEERAGGSVPVIVLLFGAAALLLLIGCANVTILLLARGRHRTREMAIRHALGAGRLRLVSLLLCETLVVTTAAAVLAVAAVQQALPVLLAGVPGVVSQRAGRIAVGTEAQFFAIALTAVTVVIAGLWPAVSVSRLRSTAMRSAAMVRSGAGAGRFGSAVLVGAQVSIAMVLLAGTGAAIRTLVDLYAAPPGYDPARVTVAQVYLPAGRYTAWRERVALFERLRTEVAREAGVEHSSLSLIPTGPPPRTGVATRIEADGLRADDREVLAHAVASDYFSTLKMALARGRVWTADDDSRAAKVAVINETMARQLWPGDDPIGKYVRDRSFAAAGPAWMLRAPGADGWFQIIGVIRDVPNRGLREPIAPAMYYPYTSAPGDMAVLLVRTKGNPAAAERDLRIAVSRADDNLPIIRFITPGTFMGWQEHQFVAAVLLGLGGVAILLAAGGLFSVASYAIAHRTGEFAIRMALGATRRAVVRTALHSMVIAVAAGLTAGAIFSLMLGSVLERWSIRNVDDPFVLAGVIAALLATTAAAAVVPARRATAIEPVAALRRE